MQLRLPLHPIMRTTYCPTPHQVSAELEISNGRAASRDRVPGIFAQAAGIALHGIRPLFLMASHRIASLGRPTAQEPSGGTSLWLCNSDLKCHRMFRAGPPCGANRDRPILPAYGGSVRTLREPFD